MCGYSPSGKWQRILLVMKLKIFFLLCCLGSLQAGVYSQVNQFSVQKTDVLVTEVLEELQSRSDYRFFYQKGIFGENDRVSVDFENASLQQVLDEVLVKRGFGYEIIDKVITIRRLQQQKNTKIQIKGLVTDTKKQPLPGVTVMIKGTSLGTVTDAEGHYVLTNPAERRTGFGIFVCRDEFPGSYLQGRTRIECGTGRKGRRDGRGGSDRNFSEVTG